MPSLQIDLPRYQAALDELPFGKRLPQAVYVFWGADFPVPALLYKLVLELKADFDSGNECNVVKFHTKELKISLLSYPGFQTDPHPALAHSVTIDLAAGKSRKTGYRKRSNPPILHRKEAFLPADHPDLPKYRALTLAEEEAGLFDDARTIGFRENWERLLSEKNITFRDHRLLERGQSTASSPAPNEVSQNGQSTAIDRHKTALSRSELSKPVKCLLNGGILTENTSFFDYGCGLGDDVGGLRELGYPAKGWDPHFAPRNSIESADVVNLGFILNVIEDPAERVEVLTKAWEITDSILAVSVLIAGQETYSAVRPLNDGVITNRNTFQKHFEQEELCGLIEHALHAEPIPVSLGIVFVFRHIEDQQDFLASRTKRSIDWENVNQRLRALRPSRLKLSVYEQNPELLDDYWHHLLELGRTPRPDEYSRIDEIRSLCKSANKATDLFIDKHGPDLLEEARRRRKEDLLVYLAAGEFQKRRTPFSHLSKRLRTDLKTFFGTYASACDEARDLLFLAGDSDEIESASVDLEFGWFDAAEGHFTIHRSLHYQLPPILRIYVECGARLYGDPNEADLIKIHTYSGKLTFLHYDNFEGNSFPVLETRIKIDLRRQFVNVIDHSTGPKGQILFFKERFLGQDHPKRKSMEQLSSRLRKLGINESMLGPNDRLAPTKEEFEEALARIGLTKGLQKKAR